MIKKHIIRILASIGLAIVLGRIGVLTRRLQQHTPQSFTRRTFVRNTVLGGVGIVLLEAAAGFLYFFWPLKTGAFGTEVIVPASAIPPVGEAPYRDQAGKFYIISNDDGALALYWKCTHLGCTVPWNEAEGQWHCPCHGSVFDRPGVRVAGPAPRPMDLMAMSVDPSGNVIVNTGDITERSEFTPGQAVQIGV